MSVVADARQALEDARVLLDDALDVLATIEFSDEPFGGGDAVEEATQAGIALVVVVSALLPVINDLREGGAAIAEAPIEDEALRLVVANGPQILAAMHAEVAHLEEVVRRVMA